MKKAKQMIIQMGKWCLFLGVPITLLICGITLNIVLAYIPGNLLITQILKPATFTADAGGPLMALFIWAGPIIGTFFAYNDGAKCLVEPEMIPEWKHDLKLEVYAIAIAFAFLFFPDFMRYLIESSEQLY
ncbi:hypothetical protein [Furfurilactobacillus entadae]|uniref:hypothetical protein n=1 Tax=Furfurilactobacillus entadae TaxID=2922307 RepID=UPI0035E61613